MGAAARCTGALQGRDGGQMCLEDVRHGEQRVRGMVVAGTRRSSATEWTTTKPSKPSEALSTKHKQT